MKKCLLFTLSCFLLSPPLYSQGFAGINTGNYAGITGAILQPASIVDSRFKFDMNLFSTDVRYSNNYFLLNRNVLLKLDKNSFDNYGTFRSKYLSEAILPAGEKVFFNISNRTQLPLSFMMTLSKKSAVAFNLQSRSMIQGRDISQDLARLAFNSFYHQPLNNRIIDASGLTLRSLSWVEAGLTYGRVLLNSGNHFLKGALTAKYLGGVSSLNLVSNNLTARVGDDSTFSFTADRVNYDHNKNAGFNKVIDSRFRPDANALGMDAGLVYEYRGHLNNIKYIRNDDEESHEVARRDLNKYIFRLGVSLLDAGMFRFTKAASVNAFRADITNWDIRNSRYSSLREFDTALANRVTPLANDPREYNMYLPGALSVQLDIRFVKGLYLNALAYRPLKIGNEAGARFNNYGYYSITPRYERRHVGIYIPYTFSDRNEISNYRDNWIGMTLRLGPLFFGSSNLGSMAFNQNLKAADFFVGLKLGLTYGKPSNITRLFSTKKETPYNNSVIEKEKEALMALENTRAVDDNNRRIKRDMVTANRIIVDYSKGHIYTDGKTGQVIIINNHYHYDNASANGSDTNHIDRKVQPFDTRRNTYSLDPAISIRLAQMQRTDSANRVVNDSLMLRREQLDNLIDRLFKLRQKLDSAGGADNFSGYNNQRNGEIINLQDTTTREEVVQNRNPDSNDHLRSITLLTDSMKLGVAKTVKNEPSKKKVASPAAVKQLNAVGSGSLQAQGGDSAVSVNNAMAQRQLTFRNDSYEDYLRQTERLQADIDRLERQMTYNRSVAYNVVPPQPNYNQPRYQNPVLPATGSYPVSAPVSSQAGRDTVHIRDTVFLTKTDTITKNVQSTPTTVTMAVPQEKIVKEKIDYTKLPPENILFASGQSAIRQVYLGKLDYLADVLRNSPELMISIAGHTDKTGLQAANNLLSLKRATAVKTFFVRKGIGETRMQVTAVAAEDPLVEGDTQNAKTQNRRVEIKILK